MKKLLIVNYHGVGDNIMMTPSIRNLKQKNPQIKIYILVIKEYTAIKDIWSTNPYVEEVIVSNLSYHPRFWNPILFYFRDFFRIKKEAKDIARKYNISNIIIIKQQYLPEAIERKLPFLPKHRVDRIAYELGIDLENFMNFQWDRRVAKEKFY